LHFFPLKVAKEEVQGFVGAFDRLASGSANFKRPTLTIVVCQRGSNYRIIPEHINPNAKAPQQNVCEKIWENRVFLTIIF
jgi:hypothetical protein